MPASARRPLLASLLTATVLVASGLVVPTAAHAADISVAPAVISDSTIADDTSEAAVDEPTPQPSGSPTADPGTPEPEDTGAPEEPAEPEEPEAPALPTIAEIQGPGDASPLVGETVTTRGVVTASYPTGGFNGYVIQTPGTGGAIDLASHTASDAVFVYSPNTPIQPIGAYVEVTGTVGEFGGSPAGGAGRTEITASAVVALDEQVAAPEPVAVAWPADAAQRESLESMLFAPAGDYTVSNTYSTNQYGEVGLATGTTPLRQPTDAAAPGSAAADAVAADNAARAVTLDDGATTNYLTAANSSLTPPYVSLTEPVVVGASVTFDQPVIVDWRNGVYKLNPVTPLVGDGTGVDGVAFANPRTDGPADVGGDISVASFNVLNYFTTLGTDAASCRAYVDRTGDGLTVRDGCAQRGAWDAGDLARQQEKLVAAINALDADVVGLMEIENSAALGEEADEGTATLVNALNEAAGSGTWAFIASSTELPDPAEQDVITNAIIYKPAAVTPVGASRALGTESASDQAFGNAREPIGQVFRAGDGDEFLFVVNHFKSKGSAGPWPGDADTGDGQSASNESRVRQATALRDWVADIADEDDAVVLVGDFNSYSFEDPLQVLYDAGFANAEREFEVDTTSYSFSGLSGSLDHVLLNPPALARATGADIWNINSGESVALEYSRYNVHGTDFHDPGPYRASDHDPVKVGLSAAAPPIELTLLGINDFHGRIDASTVNFAGTVEQQRAAAQGPVLFLSAGDNIGASLFASSVAQDRPTLDVLNALELAATAVGNHEFDRGFADLAGRVTDVADFPQLGANVYDKGTETPALPEYALFTVDGLDVGVIGVVTEETPALVTPAGITELDFGDPVEAVNRVAAQLSDGDTGNGEADVLVALYHEGAGAGTPDGSTLEEEVAGGGAFAEIVETTSAEIDAIFTGHTHKTYAWSAPVPGTDRTRPIVQTGSYGANLGKITLTVDPASGDVVAHTEENLARTTTPAAELIADYPRVAEVHAIVEAALAAAAEVGNTAVAEVAADITTAFSGGEYVDGVWTGGSRDDRASESALGNLVADAIRDSLSNLPNGAVIGVTNSGGLRSELWDTQAEFGDAAVPGMADGTISFSQATAVLPFNNTMALVSLTGAQFVDVLEQQWQRDAAGDVPSRPYLQLGLSENVSYTYDATMPEGSRITSVTVDGEPLDPDAEYRVGTLSFLASGGDNFRAFTQGTDFVDTGLLDYEAWIDFLADNSPVAPSFAKHAVQVTGVPESVDAGGTVQFDVSGLNLTSRGAPENTSLTVSLGDTELGTVAVAAGAATVSVHLPAGTPPGTATLTLTAAQSGTTVSVPITVAASQAAIGSTTSLIALPPLHINRLLPATLLAVVSTDDGTRAQGVVEFRSGGATGTVVATAEVRGGLATHRLGTLGRGVQQYTAVFVPTDPTQVASSTSSRALVVVLF